MSATLAEGAMLAARGLAKSFTLHLRGGARIAVLDGVDLDVGRGECVALDGPSGAGKSTLLRSLYGTNRLDRGSILLRHGATVVDLATAPPRLVLEVRAKTLGYVTQFLRVVPRVATLDVVAEAAGSREAAREWLRRLNLPAQLHALPPATFSGGEQQRVNLARGLAGNHPVLLLDEPTASLDDANRDVVVGMIQAAKAKGTAIVGIFHDRTVRRAVADRCLRLAAA